MTAPWLKQEVSGYFILTLHIQPGAKKTGVAGQHGDALKIRLAAPPIDGKANDCLIEFIADKLGVARLQVELTSGTTSRRKRIRVRGVTQEAIEKLVG
ncbi:MAG: YggU family protein [Rhodocyclaceae bacterium]|nr:YggU family protein [Rhodocyclaceae bacterium]